MAEFKKLSDYRISDKGLNLSYYRVSDSEKIIGFPHLHLVGPLPASSDGPVYLLTIVKRLTRRVEAVPLSKMEASTCTDVFISLGIKHVLTTAYHPQCDGWASAQADQGCSMCTWCGFHVALLSSLGADGSACNSKGGFGCVLSRAGHWVPTHPPGPVTACAGPTRVDVPPPPPPPKWPAYYAVVINTQPVHWAKADHVYVRPAEASGYPICRPLPGGLQEGQDVHHLGGQKAGDRLRGQTDSSVTGPFLNFLIAPMILWCKKCIYWG